MKKTILTMFISILLIFGIDGVKAAFPGTTDASCRRIGNTENACQYECTVEYTNDQKYYKFNYDIKKVDGKIVHEVNDKNTEQNKRYQGTGEFPHYNNIPVYKVGNSYNVGNIALSWATLGLNNVSHSTDVLAAIVQGMNIGSDKIPYIYLGLKIIGNPSDNKLVSNGKLICPPDIDAKVTPDTTDIDNVFLEIDDSIKLKIYNYFRTGYGTSWPDLSNVSVGDKTMFRFVKNKVFIKVHQESSEFDFSDEYQSACGYLGGNDSKTVIFLKKIYGYIKILIPLMVIAYGIMDFIKVIGTGKDDDLKKAIRNTIIRLIIAVVFILVPIIISLMIKISGLSAQYPSLGGGLKAIFCILE